MDPEGYQKWVRQIEEVLLKQLGEALGDKVAEHALRPCNAGSLEDPDGEATVSGMCEDTVRIQLRLKGERIDGIAFMTSGCAATVACSSMVTELAKGATLKEALAINGKRVIEALGGLPIEHTHCADLAANALKAAVRNAMETRNEPWKRLYRPRGAVGSKEIP